MNLSIALLLATASPELPGWMAGCWEQKSGNCWSEECWTYPRAGMMMGSSRSGRGDQLREWETMQIVREVTDDPAIARMSFHGAPRGQNRTKFDWVPDDEAGLSFINASHDFPQRIRYWREGEDLVAEISLLDGSRAMRWRYRRMGN